MIDPRNRPALIGAALAGAATFVLLWLLGLSPLLAWIAGWSLPAFAMYGIDKRQSGRGGWRVPEALLHGLALIGGFIGAWAGRSVFRHKTRKTEFTVVLVVATVAWAVLALWALLD
jgi:uncharacterized membrane protein YsdA (DUF1294 family)